MHKQLLVAVGLMAGLSAPAPMAGQAGPGDASTYRVVHGWPVLSDGMILGQATGVGVDSNDNVWVFHRAGRAWSDPFPTDPIGHPTVVQFDGTTGAVLREWGASQFIMPHGLTVDPQDNVWVTDVALHQVFKFAPDGRLLLTLGERGVPGADGIHFNQPTDVAVLSDGSFYVSDGYINTRVAKFSPEGKYLAEWGGPGSAAGQFDLPHGIAVDDRDRVYVADRSNARIQVFDTSGRFLEQWSGDTLGRPYGVAVGPRESIFLVDGGDQPINPPDRSGAIHLDRTGKVIARFGLFGNYDGQFRMAHDVAVDSQHNVYVVDVSGQRVQKFVRAH